MESLDERLDKVCWRLTTKLTPTRSLPDGPSNTVLDYFDLHTKLTNVSRFHRDYMSMQGADEELVYRAMCYIEEAVLTPLSGAHRGVELVHCSLQVLLGLAHPHFQMGDGAKRFLDDLTDGIARALESDPNR